MFLVPLLSSLLIQGVFSTILFPLLFSTHSRLLLYLLVSSTLLFSTHSRLLIYRLVSSSLLYSFKVPSLTSCPPFFSLLIQGFFSMVLFPLRFSTIHFLVSSTLLLSTHSRLLLCRLVSSSVLYSFKVFFSTFLSPLLFSTHSRRLLYHLVSSSLLYSFNASSLPSCPPCFSLLI